MRSRIVRFLIRNGPATSADIASALQASSPTIRRHLELMRGAGLVERADQRFSVRTELVREQATETASTFGLTVMPDKPQIPMNEGRIAKPFPQERNNERIE
ncbi:helix-turn-helix domain-containing protein [Arthrobacter sp. 2MCAF14]|uniref:helix-turn-helix domain-containing protein n=1 Tax=Arthrobacter sp. 2MCAF14 TaxID=3232982 RepID=UPI003F923950